MPQRPNIIDVIANAAEDARPLVCSHEDVCEVAKYVVALEMRAASEAHWRGEWKDRAERLKQKEAETFAALKAAQVRIVNAELQAHRAAFAESLEDEVALMGFILADAARLLMLARTLDDNSEAWLPVGKLIDEHFNTSDEQWREKWMKAQQQPPR